MDRWRPWGWDRRPDHWRTSAGGCCSAPGFPHWRSRTYTWASFSLKHPLQWFSLAECLAMLSYFLTKPQEPLHPRPGSHSLLAFEKLRFLRFPWLVSNQQLERPMGTLNYFGSHAHHRPIRSQLATENMNTYTVHKWRFGLMNWKLHEQPK